MLIRGTPHVYFEVLEGGDGGDEGGGCDDDGSALGGVWEPLFALPEIWVEHYG